MHPEQRALLDGIIADPADDTRRLVYADWLEENDGGNRADFIAQEVSLASLKPCVATSDLPCGVCDYCKAKIYCENFHQDPNLWSLISREFDPDNRINYAHAHFDNMQDLQQHAANCKWLTLYTSRGFVSAVSCTMAQWLKHGPAICSEHPVERVVITDKRPWHSVAGWTYFGNDVHAGWADRVPTYIQDERRNDANLYFPTAEATNADLSAKCIAWAREQANQLTTEAAS